MNNKEKEILIILQEECAEVIQEASKIFRFVSEQINLLIFFLNIVFSVSARGGEEDIEAGTKDGLKRYISVIYLLYIFRIRSRTVKYSSVHGSMVQRHSNCSIK